MKKKVSLDELRDFKINYCDKFFPKNLNTWSSVVLIECMEDYDLMEEIKKYISIKCDEISAKELDALMQELRDKTNQHINELNNVESKEEFYKIFTRSLVYYGVLESLDELASFSTDLINEIRKKYDDKYLEVISKFDKANLSVDGKKVLDTLFLEKDFMLDELLQKYKVLKEWQDKQHGYYQSVIEPLMMKMSDEYETQYPINIEVGFEQPYLHKMFYELCNKSLISIEEIAKCYLCGIDTELVKLVGGKAYGLAVLKAKGIEIPRTFVVPVTAKKLEDNDYNLLNSDINFSVRSSADIEDGKNNSFAGMFDSYLNVSYRNVPKTIERVIASKNNSRLQEYIEVNGLKQPSMAVVLQDFIEPEYAGVWIGKNKDSGYLEYVSGNGEKLVSGKVNPEREIWENGKSDNKSLTCSSGEIGKLLLEYQNLVAKNNSDVADFEWMILDNRLIMLQYRPVTTKLNMNMNLDEIKDGVYYGIPASPGKVTASSRFVNARYINELKDWNDGDILMAWYTDPEWMNILSHSSGIVTAVGGFLCHAAIIARELGIPCVIGIGGDSMKNIWNEKELTIDGDNGTVSVLNKKKKH